MAEYPRAVRFRVGVARFDDGWNVVVEFDGKREVYDPTYETEAEAEVKAAELARSFRQTLADRGTPFINNRRSGAAPFEGVAVVPAQEEQA